MSARVRTWAIGAIAVIAGIAVYWYVSEQRDERARVAIRAKAQALKEEMDRRFPPGSPAEAVTEFLDRQPAEGRSSSIDGDYWLSIGQAPSGVWYCGPIDHGITVVFRDGRLQSTRVDSRAFNCL